MRAASVHNMLRPHPRLPQDRRFGCGFLGCSFFFFFFSFSGFYFLLFFFWKKKRSKRKSRDTGKTKGARPERPLPRVPSPVSRSQPCGKTSAQNASCHSMCQKLFYLQCQGFPNRHRECQGHYFVRLTKRRRRQKCFLLLWRKQVPDLEETSPVSNVVIAEDVKVSFLLASRPSRYFAASS